MFMPINSLIIKIITLIPSYIVSIYFINMIYAQDLVIHKGKKNNCNLI